jgi:3-deoxy-D-manno-octulosonic-acid transferase
MRILYNIAFFIFGIFYLPYLVVTRRYRYGLKEKLGFLSEEFKSICAKNKIIWIHAVSLGEMKAVGPLIPLLRKAFPDRKLIFSTITNTGYNAASKMLKEEEAAFYLPFDLSFIVSKVVDIVKPEIFISMEAELWPNLIESVYARGARLIMINGRISPRSYSRHKKAKFFIANLLKKFSLLLMQSESDAKRIKELGGQEEKVFVTGNLKFDLGLKDSKDDRGRLRKKLNLNEKEMLLICGSTSKGEESVILDCFKNLKDEYSDLRLLIAPRHIERTVEIEKLILKYKFSAVRMSSLNLKPETLNQGTVFILDTIGELRSMYSASDIVFVGGSLIKRGGQNPIEPASFAKPMIFGKHTYNFQDVIKMLLENNAGIEVQDRMGLYKAIKDLLGNPEKRNQMGYNAKAVVGKNSGSSQRTINLILSNFS